MDFSDSHQVVLFGATLGLAALCLALSALWLRSHNALLAARTAERHFSDVYENINEGVFRCTLDGIIFKANPAIYRLHGFENERDMLDHANDLAQNWYVDPARREEIGRLMKRSGRVDGIISEVQRYKSRERLWVEEHIRLVYDERSGQPRCIEGTVRDVTDAVRRIELQQRTEKIASLVSGCLYQQKTWPDGRVELPYISVGLKSLLGIDPEDAQRDPWLMFALVHPDDKAALLESFAKSAETLTARHFEYRVVLADGTEKWVRGQSVPEVQAEGSLLWHGFLADVTDSRRATERVYDLAYLDTLTGLPNRAALVDRLEGIIGRPREGMLWSALLFIDLDQFKVLNDTKGHHVGDRLLAEVAERLRPICGEKDFVARLGGDEFVIVVRDLAVAKEVAEQQVSRVVERLHDTVAQPFVLDGYPFRTSASVGVALFRGRETNIDELLKRADMAMYEAKATGRGAASFFVSEMQEVLEERQALTTELREAVEEGLLVLHYQPQVDENGVAFGVEALLRWDHPVRGPVPPAVFIPLAERAGFSELIDAFVLSEACATLNRWRQQTLLSHLRMAVNIGGRRVDNDLVELLTSAISATGADPERLTIELTEHVMLDNVAEVDAALAALKDLGVKIFLDDFGTGYSSLSHLKRLPIDALKIDCSFVRDIETDQNDRVIVQTILNIARNLGMMAIAEGVENDIQALLLRRFGCRAFQGFMYGRPMPREEAERWFLAAERSRSAVLPPTRLVV